MGKAVSSLTDAVGLTNYDDQRDAARNATNAQMGMSREQLAYQKEADALARKTMQPFVDQGLANMPGFQALMTSGGQQDYLNSNPMFQAAVNNSGDQIKAAGAAQGKYGSGGMVNQLFQNYLGQGEQFVDNQFNRLLQSVNMGQASAAGQTANSLNSANNVSNILGNQGDILSSGIMARQNINNSAVSGGTKLLMQGAAMFGGGGMFPSDRRLKTDIKEIGRDDLGGVYEFRYKGDDLLMIGRMADELVKTRPDAVFEDDSGYLMVTAEFKPRAA